MVLTCAGWFGLLFYAIASGLPILLQGFLGPFVQRRKPDLLSFTDYVNQVPHLAPSLALPALLRYAFLPSLALPLGLLFQRVCLTGQQHCISLHAWLLPSQANAGQDPAMYCMQTAGIMGTIRAEGSPACKALEMTGSGGAADLRSAH